MAGVLYLLGDFASIAAAAFVSSVIDNAAVAAASVIYIGVRQRYITNLVHECSHLKLVRSGRFNRVLGHIITATMGESFADYQDGHRDHHAKLGRDGDPKIRRYASKGATRLRRDKFEFVLYVILWNAAWNLPLETVTGWFTKHPQESRRAVLTRAAFWAGVFGVGAWSGSVLAILVYWVVPLALVRPMVNWTTDIGNHVGLMEHDDPIHQTRGWSSHALARHFLGGHMDDMYHPTHHWCPRIPFRMLPAATELIRASNASADEAAWCSGYFFRRRSTPDVRCVLEDVVMALREAPVIAASAEVSPAQPKPDPA